MPYKRTEVKKGKKQTIYIGQVKKEGRRIEKRFKMKKEALAWEVMMRGQPSKDWQKKTDTVSLGDLAVQYLDYAKDTFSKGTYEEKKSVFLRFFRMFDPTISIEQLNPAQVMQYSQVQMKERSGNAANKDKKNLMAAWNWGTMYMTPALPKDNPFDIMKMPEVRSPRYVPPMEDFRKVYKVAEGQDKVMLLACLYLAARRGEIFRLKVKDLDFENDKVRLWTRKREDGNWEYDWLPMGAELRESFRYWLYTREIASEYVFVCVDKTEFTKEYYGQPFTSRQHLFERLCKKAKVDKFGFHAIRHLTATQLYKQGSNVAEIQRVLRHTSPNTTVRYLKTLGVDDIRTAMDSFQATCKEALD